MSQSHAAALWIPSVGSKIQKCLEAARVEEEAFEVFTRKRPVAATCAVLALDAHEDLQWNFSLLDEVAKCTARELGVPVFALYAVFGSADHFRVTQFLANGRKGWTEAECEGRWKKSHRVLAKKLKLELATEDEDEDDDVLRFSPVAAAYWRLFVECFPGKKPVELLPLGLKPALDLSDEGWTSHAAPAPVLKRVEPELTPYQVAERAAEAGDLKTLQAQSKSLLREYALRLMRAGGWPVFELLRASSPSDAKAFLEEKLLGDLDDVKEALAHGAKPANAFALLQYVRDPRVLEVLIKHGVRVTDRNDSGETLLHAHSDARCIKLLVEAGAKPEVANARGNTPLAVAVGYLEPERVKALIKVGASTKVLYNGLSLLETLDRIRAERKPSAELNARVKAIRALL